MNVSETKSEVLALKYRPKRFEDLIGQETISQTLSLALDSSRLSHAYLFSGLRGSGKTSTARIFAKALMCDTGPGSRPCEVCEHCVMANEGRHIDIIEMDAASSRKIDDIRDLIEHTKYKPASARFKIFIIDEVHMLTKEAFNALLKTLEEPPRFVKFILATTDPLKLPATILSRTQHFRFKKISTINIVNHLSHILHLEKIDYENEALEILARSGSGSLRDTLTLLDQAIIFSKNFVDVSTVTDMLGLVDPEFINAIFTSIFAKDQAAVIAHVKALEDYEAEMVVDELIAYLKERLYQQDRTYSTLILERFFRILSDAKSLFGLNADGSFVLSLVFFKMLEALRIKEVDQMIEELEAQIERPEITMKKAQTPRQEPATKEKSPLPDEDETAQTPQQSETPPPQAVKPDIGLLNFEKLLGALNDRSAELGKCFGDNISYVSFEEGKLTWESCAEEECKEKLRHGWGVINHFVKEIFGFETKIKNLSCSKQAVAIGETDASSDKQGQDAVSSVKEMPQPPLTQQTQAVPAQEESSPAAQEPQNSSSAQTHSYSPNAQEMDEQPLQESFSMLEDEIMDGSCVSGCASEDPSRLDEASKEIDATSIMEEPMIKMAQEMFEATKITIQSKV
ncbi:MAG: DNA polymerase III subunit gamma/tau [Campylobacterales bacterium]|nr:DNA polymerase III subunit gamma/tau [Campylobacterales bacterium]